MNKNLEHPVSKYLSSIQYYRSKSTLERLRFTLNMILKELQGSVEYDDLIRWSQWKQTQIQKETWVSYVSALNGFLEWCVREGDLLINPIPKEWNHLRCFPTVKIIPAQEEMNALLECDQENVKFPLRNLAILELCYSVGLRRAEVVSLRLDSIQGDQVRVIGKGNKERLLPLSKLARRRVETYLQAEREPLLNRLGRDSHSLFLNYKGRGLKPGDLTHIFKNQLKLKYSPHTFRHACASHMLQNGCSLRVLQKYLGHESLESTQVYTRVDLGDLREMLGKCHLRG